MWARKARKDIQTTKGCQLRKRLFRSGMIVSSMTMLSRVVGLLRDGVLAAMFGAGGGADAFFVAFKIPNFLRRLFGEGAFAQAFVPVLAETMGRDPNDPRAVRALVAAVSGVLFAVLALVTLAVVMASDYVVWVFAPGFAADPAKLGLAGDLLQLTFPYLFFIAGVAFAGSILNAHDRFAVPAFTPVLLNLSLIASAIWLSPHLEVSVMALGWGVLIAGATQLAFQLPFLARLGLLPRPRWQPRDPGVRQIGRLMLPALFGVGVSQINLLLDTILASFLENGSVSWLYYSDRLVELPLGVIGIAIATVILPKLSHAAAAKTPDATNQIQDWGLGICVILGVPATAALWLLAEPLLTTLFLYGALELRDVTQASLSLRAYALGLLPFMFIKVLAPGYFSRQDTRTPVRIAIWAMVANMAFNLALIGPLAHVGLAAATSLSAALNAGLLWLGLRRRGWYQPRLGWRRLMVQVGVSSAVMAAVLAVVAVQIGEFSQLSMLARAGWAAVLVGSGVASYVAGLLVLGFKPAGWLGSERD
ncbi:murein biosynthesis integral membrane protein MurJ [Litorivicinus lipolyticus]|uniref:Probable lipid II flippase MurJ n=2 Tax=Litorivicinus lipolyticus TaxID=418701 RepID=A0A5Q2QIL7_9GAMM|nr:murein biosynthesis integral membrane protein MurJ [Litorivicinus lipolyticus]QGG80905.1 murein biosynthesis integral membrane protein MurJ [Litorivicinus lipolyticus]